MMNILGNTNNSFAAEQKNYATILIASKKYEYKTKSWRQAIAVNRNEKF